MQGTKAKVYGEAILGEITVTLEENISGSTGEKSWGLPYRVTVFEGYWCRHTDAFEHFLLGVDAFKKKVEEVMLDNIRTS